MTHRYVLEGGADAAVVGGDAAVLLLRGLGRLLHQHFDGFAGLGEFDPGGMGGESLEAGA